MKQWAGGSDKNLGPILTMLVLYLFLLQIAIVYGSNNKEPVGQNLVVFLIDGYGASLFNRTNAKVQHGRL